jgi:hypothetical protein
MTRPPLALVLAALVMGMPIARQLCDAACADTAVLEHTPHHRHSHAAPQTPPEGGRVDQLSRACAVLDAIVTGSRESKHFFSAALSAKSFNPDRSDAPSAVSTSLGSRHALQLPVRSPSALRI